MKYISKSEVPYIVMYNTFSILTGFLYYEEKVGVFYQFSYVDILEVGTIELLSIAMWAFPKMIAIIFLVQYFVHAYETSYIYFKIRSHKDNLWFYQIIKNISVKLLFMCLIKLCIVVFIARKIDVLLFVYEYIYILLFLLVYICLYLLIHHEKLMIYVVIGHLLLYELSAMNKLEYLERYLFLCDVSAESILAICGMTIILMGSFNHLLKYKNESIGGRV